MEENKKMNEICQSDGKGSDSVSDVTNCFCMGKGDETNQQHRSLCQIVNHKKTINILQLSISVIMTILFMLLLLFVSHGNFILYVRLPIFLIYIVPNTIFVFIKADIISKNVQIIVGFIFSIIVLIITFWLSMISFLTAAVHGSALIPTPLDNSIFIIASFFLATVAIITLFVINLALIREERNKSSHSNENNK